MVGHLGSSAGSYLADPTSPIPSHCASIVVTSTLRVKLLYNGVQIEGLFIESWSGSAGYSAEMLTEDGKSWRVEDESTLASSVNIEAEYPALADHEELE